MDFSIIFHSISLIAILILLGAIVSRYYKFNNDTKQMYITLITNVAMPSIILASIFKVEIKSEMFKSLAIVFIISILINLLGLSIGYLISIILKQEAKKIEIAVLSAFGNTGFIGIPLCAVLFGPEGALYAAIFDAGVDFTMWTVGVYLLQDNKRFNWKTLKDIINLPLIAIIVGISIGVLGIQVPYIVSDTFDHLAAFAVPLAMFYIGATMSHFQGGNIKNSHYEIAIPIVVKLILLPFLVILIAGIFNFDELIISIIIVQSLMPALTLSSVLFAKYSRDDHLGAFVTIFSTLVSLVTIPVILYFVNAII